jgi:hypothetical protein
MSLKPGISLKLGMAIGQPKERIPKAKCGELFLKCYYQRDDKLSKSNLLRMLWRSTVQTL